MSERVAMVNIFVTDYQDSESCAVAARLRSLITSSSARYSLVDCPDEADFILVASHGNEIPFYKYILSAVSHPVISAYPSNAFSVSFRDRPVIFHHGVYESPVASAWSSGRVVPGFYQLSGTLNPEVRVPDDHPIPKRYLASFIGRNSHPCRGRLLTHRFGRSDVFIEDSSSFNMWSKHCLHERQHRLQRYGEVLRSSKFALCPRGCGTGSIRLFEALKAGVAPVVISDDWVPPCDRKWHEFCLVFPENRIDQLESMLESEEHSAAERGALAFAYYQSELTPETYIDYLLRHLYGLKGRNGISERHYWKLRHLVAAYHVARFSGSQAYQGIRNTLSSILRICSQ